jgi:signal transduction histidine kinase
MAPGSRHDRPGADGDLRESIAHELIVVLHEIRQPLSAIFALAESARGRDDVPPDVRDLMVWIIEETQEVSAAMQNVVAQSVGPDHDDESVDVDEVLASVLESFRRTWDGRLGRQGEGGSTVVSGGRPAVRRCMVNVIDNAIRAAGPGGTVTVTVHRSDESVRIAVDDDGPGFGRVPVGTGFGLPLTRQALRRMGGDLLMDLPSRNGGACVVLRLPVARHGPELARPVRAG